jgi:hypothetical protein
MNFYVIHLILAVNNNLFVKAFKIMSQLTSNLRIKYKKLIKDLNFLKTNFFFFSFAFVFVTQQGSRFFRAVDQDQNRFRNIPSRRNFPSPDDRSPERQQRDDPQDGGQPAPPGQRV